MTTPTEFDLTGLKCPMPIVRLTQMIKGVAPGHQVVVTADDPAFRPDLQAWCRSTGHELIAIEQVERRLVATLRKKKA